MRSIFWSIDAEIVASGIHDKLFRVSGRTGEPLFLLEQGRRMDENSDLTLLEDDGSHVREVRVRQIKILDDSATGKGVQTSKLNTDAVMVSRSYGIVRRGRNSKRRYSGRADFTIMV